MKINKKECRKFANKTFPISMNNGLLYLEDVKYIVRVNVRNIARKRILILYFCAVKDVKDGLLTPKFVVFQARDEFTTLEYCEDGKSKWRQSKTVDLGPGYHSFCSDCAFYNRNEELMVIRFCSKEKDKGFYALEHLQLNLVCKRSAICKRKREAVIKKRMQYVRPLAVKSIKAWLQKEIFPAHIFYYYKKGSKIQNGYCTHCHEKVQLFSPRHGAKTVCPSCGWTATTHATGRNSRVHDRTTILYLQKYGEELLIRVCKASVSYKDYLKPDISVWENARFFLNRDIKNPKNEVYYYSYGSDKLTPWAKGYRPCFNRWAYYFEADTAGHIFTPNLGKVLSGTPWQYSQLKEYYLSDKETMDLPTYLRTYQRHPVLEYLVKLRLYKLVTFEVYGDKRSTFNENPLNMDGRNINDVLGVGRQYLPLMQDIDIDRGTFCLMKKMISHSVAFDRDFLKWCQDNILHDFDELRRCLNYMTGHKLMRYLEEQSDGHTYAASQYYGETPVKRAFGEYKDYIRFCEDLEYDLSDDFVLFPRDLHDAHNRASEMFNDKKVEIYNKKITAEYEKLEGQYQFTKYGLTVLPPKTASEIVAEGHALHHCVGGYVSRVADKECVILFLRKENEPDIPFYTIEVKDGRVFQIRGENNCDPPPNVKHYMKVWEQEKLLPAVAMQQAA